MDLEPLGTFRLQYDQSGLTLVRPFAGHEAQGFGTGTGSIDGRATVGCDPVGELPTDERRRCPDA